MIVFDVFTAGVAHARCQSSRVDFDKLLERWYIDDRSVTTLTSLDGSTVYLRPKDITMIRRRQEPHNNGEGRATWWGTADE